MGLQYNALVYNTFCISVLGYLGQLEHPPAHVYAAEEVALRKVAKGPGKWVDPGDLWRLREHFGGARSFKSIRWMVQAAQLRVRTFDPGCKRPDYGESWRQLTNALAAPDRRPALVGKVV